MLKERSRFARLVLLNTGAFRSELMPWRIRICRAPLLGPLLVRGLNGFARAALRMAVAHPERLTADVRSGYLAPAYDSWAHRIAIDHFVDDIPMSPNHPSYATLLEIERGLPSLEHLPIELIWGMRDWCFTPAFLERFLQFWPRATVHRLADAGHWALEDESETVIRLIDQFVMQAAPNSTAAS